MIDDANDIVSKLVACGRRQTEDLVKELEKVPIARGEVEGRTSPGQDLSSDDEGAQAGGAHRRRSRGRRVTLPTSMAQADKAVAAGEAVVASFLITGYDELGPGRRPARRSEYWSCARCAMQYEKNNKARKDPEQDRRQARLSAAATTGR